jgi:tRNA (guanine37-N1)-methyltransferase
MLHLSVISIMPEMFSCLHYGITGRAIEQGLVTVDYWNPRDWSSNAHRQIDDRPYGGGPGMVMMYEPLHTAIVHAQSKMPNSSKVVYLSPQGKAVQQADLNAIVATKQSLIFLAGRYEGID